MFDYTKYHTKDRKIKKIERNWKFSYITEDGFLLSSFWFDYVYNFNEKVWLWKVILNWKYNFLNKDWILVAEWKDRNEKIDWFYPSKNSTYNIPTNLYRISRLENLNSIIDLWILSRNLSKKYLNFENNSYEHIQDRRSQFWKYNLHNYAPLFFSKYPAMLYSTKIRENINNQIIIVFDWNLITNDWIAFSDVSLAYSDITEDNLFDNLDFLKNLDFSLFENKWWENDITIRRKKWAEVLVKKRIDFKYAREILYFDKSKKEIIENILKDKWYNIPIKYNNYEDYKW